RDNTVVPRKLRAGASPAGNSVRMDWPEISVGCSQRSLRSGQEVATVLLDLAKSLTSKAVITARSVHVIRQSGLMGRPDEGIRSLLPMHKVGALAATLEVGESKYPLVVALVEEAREMTYAELVLP